MQGDGGSIGDHELHHWFILKRVKYDSADFSLLLKESIQLVSGDVGEVMVLGPWVMVQGGKCR